MGRHLVLELSQDDAIKLFFICRNTANDNFMHGESATKLKAFALDTMEIIQKTYPSLPLKCQ